MGADNATFLGGGPFCGRSDNSFPFTSFTNIVNIEFTSDDDQEGSGFVVKFKMILKEPSKIDCDFEQGICPGWVQAQNGKTDVFDWDLGRGKTESDGTGPDYDHTFQNSSGTYLFIEGSKPRLTNDYAIFISPKLQAKSDASCLEFW